MAASIYVASAEAGAGKSLVALGVCEWAVRRGGRVGFFRPVVRHDAARDASVRLVCDRYLGGVDPAALVGTDRAGARAMLAEDRVPDLLAESLAKFRAVRDACGLADSDPVVVEGTSFRGFAPTHEFDLNADLAANFGSAVLPVFTARGKTPADVRDALQIAADQFGDRGCELLAAVVNHVPEGWDGADRDLVRDALSTTFSKSVPGPVPVWLIAANPRLELPTVGEVAAGLSATWLHGPTRDGDGGETRDAAAGRFAGADRVVSRFVVAAMRVPHFLGHLTDDALVVTPGDRDDILLASLAGAASRTGPNIAGVLLTGGLTPEGPVAELVDGLAAVPVLGDDPEGGGGAGTV